MTPVSTREMRRISPGKLHCPLGLARSTKPVTYADRGCQGTPASSPRLSRPSSTSRSMSPSPPISMRARNGRTVLQLDGSETRAHAVRPARKQFSACSHMHTAYLHAVRTYAHAHKYAKTQVHAGRSVQPRALKAVAAFSQVTACAQTHTQTRRHTPTRGDYTHTHTHARTQTQTNTHTHTSTTTTKSCVDTRAGGR